MLLGRALAGHALHDATALVHRAATLSAALPQVAGRAEHLQVRWAMIVARDDVVDVGAEAAAVLAGVTVAFEDRLADDRPVRRQPLATV